MATVMIVPENRTDQKKDMKEESIPLGFLPPVLGAKFESLCTRDGRLFRWKEFFVLRQICGAWIETDEPERVYNALGLSANAPGIIVKLFSPE